MKRITTSSMVGLRSAGFLANHVPISLSYAARERVCHVGRDIGPDRQS